ncbi:MAG: flagellar motor protein MotA [Alphaproteobacteria bacterium]|nr:flagellar motor protein MotA [Alphaproteobacteria bacterium]
MGTPQRYLTRMIVFVVVVSIVCAILGFQLKDAFLSNPVLNGMILAVLVIGIVYAFRQVLLIRSEAAWADSYRSAGRAGAVQKQPLLLASVATLMQERRGSVSLTATSLRSLLDGIASRLDESRDIGRYFVGLLIFLGLLGTFWGLLKTVESVGDVITGLDFAGTDMAIAFGNLQQGLQEPLSGMGTAFSSSLFGLAGSLILGFLDLQTSQAQHRFFNDLEEWLSELTRFSGGGGEAGGDVHIPAYVQALLEQTAESLDRLERSVEKSEHDRTLLNAHLGDLVGRMAEVAEVLRSEREVLQGLAEDRGSLGQIAADQRVGTELLARLVNETNAGRSDAVEEIRSEIRLVARTIAAVREESGR